MRNDKVFFSAAIAGVVVYTPIQVANNAVVLWTKLLDDLLFLFSALFVIALLFHYLLYLMILLLSGQSVTLFTSAGTKV